MSESEGRAHHDPATTSTYNTLPRTVPQTARRIRLHHMLTRRRRWSAELDALLADASDNLGCAVAACDCVSSLDGDYWHDTFMDRGVDERRRAGWAMGRAA